MISMRSVVQSGVMIIGKLYRCFMEFLVGNKRNTDSAGLVNDVLQ